MNEYIESEGDTYKIMKEPLRSTFSFIILGLCMVTWSCNYSCVDASVGINWGRLSSQRLIPSMVVDLLLQNGIDSVRIFQQANNVLEAFYESGIRVTTGLSNNILDNYKNISTVDWWIEEKIIKYEKVIQFRYVIVGVNPFSLTFSDKMYNGAIVALKNMQNRLKDSGRSHIKATTSHYTDVFNLTSSSRPSETDFRADIKERMVEYVRFLRDTDAPFMLTMFPIHYVNNKSLDLEFAFMDNRSSYSVQDGNLIYKNAFELLYDSCYWALKKAGAENVKIVIGAIGWPTDGYSGANITNAKRFYKSFLPYIASGRGTPKRPNEKIEVFIHSLSDENQQLLDLGSFQRHWGIYEFNGQPKYEIDFSGQGRDTLPSMAKGVIRMPNRWCVFNENMDDPEKVKSLKAMACKESDCSSLDRGGSCSILSDKEQVSYAFNRYFQAKGQATEASNEKCDMGGLGKVVSVDPSTKGCKFPVEILSAEYAVEGATFGTMDSGRERVHGGMSASAGLLALAVLWMIV